MCSRFILSLSLSLAACAWGERERACICASIFYEVWSIFPQQLYGGKQNKWIKTILESCYATKNGLMCKESHWLIVCHQHLWIWSMLSNILSMDSTLSMWKCKSKIWDRKHMMHSKSLFSIRNTTFQSTNDMEITGTIFNKNGRKLKMIVINFTHYSNDLGKLTKSNIVLRIWTYQTKDAQNRSRSPCSHSSFFFFSNSIGYVPSLVNIFWICGWAVDDLDWLNIPMHCCGNAAI